MTVLSIQLPFQAPETIMSQMTENQHKQTLEKYVLRGEILKITLTRIVSRIIFRSLNLLPLKYQMAEMQSTSIQLK